MLLLLVVYHYSFCFKQIAEPLLPYALAFAAGAMIYVVVDDLIPESHTRFVKRVCQLLLLLLLLYCVFVVF